MNKKPSLTTQVSLASENMYSGTGKEVEENVTKDKNDVKAVPFYQIYRYSSGQDKLLLFFGSLCAIGTGVCQPLSILVFGTLTQDIITYALDIEKNEAEFMNSITMFAVYNSSIGAGMLILSYLSTVLFNYSAIRQIFQIRKLYFSSALNQDISWYDVNQTGDYASRMSEDMIKLQDGMGEKVAMFFHFQVAFLASIILALIKGWKLALICLTSLPISMIAMGTIAFITSRVAKKEMDAYGAAGAIAEEVFSAIRTVMAFGGQHKEIERYGEKLVFARNNNIKRSLLAGIGFGLLWFFIYASYALAFWYGVQLVVEERGNPDPDYDAGTMITVFFSVMQGSMNFGMSSSYIEVFGIAKGAAAKIFSVIDNIPVINISKNNGKKLDQVKGNIVLKDVVFDYPSRPDVKVLQGVNLTINSGETVALVGSSGCGKSTVIQLLQRFYDPLSGQIYLDDEKFNELDLTWLRNNIGVVGQEPVLFGTTIAENIRYGNLNATQDEIERAAQRANAHIFISSLPQGYDTLVGERGAQLSGGQKQRISIARALVREPSILLLDEATSALDTNSEAKVQNALDHASKGCTTIIVAHRLSTIRNANRIVVFSAGKIVEEGTHKMLMAKQGTYYNLVKTQSSPDEADELDEDQTDDIKMIEDKKMSLVEDVIDEADLLIESNETSSTSLWAIMKVNGPEWWNIVIGCFTSVIMGAAMPAFAVFFGEIIAVLGSTESDEQIYKKTNTFSLVFVIAGLITGAATFLQIYMFGVAGEKLTMRLRNLMFVSMLTQEIGWFDRKENAVGSLCAKLSNEAASVQGATGQRIGTILQALSTLVISISLSMYYEWRLALVALAYTPIILAAIFFEHRLVHVENDGQQKSLEKSTKIAVEAVSSIRTVASLGCENSFYQSYVAELLPIHNTSKRNTHVRAIVIGIARSIMFFAFANCMYYGGVLIKNKEMTFEKVYKVSQALIMGTVSIASALAFAPNLRKGLDAAEKIFHLLNRSPLIRDHPNSISKEWSKSDITYKEVCFSYPTRPTIRVLKGFNLSIFEGQTVALVGPSGCGKSTVLQLLERYYDPTEGEVSVEGEDIKKIKLATLRSQIGVVSQEPNLFDKTIGENIAYGRNDQDVKQAEIIAAAKKANIHNFIVSLPLGYNTRLGERGTQLSGGQKQRIAIARALVRNPKVLMLDEATSALDTESEKVVQEALEVAKEGRTSITIAHRLTTIQDADVICVVNQGVVAEMGTHSELLKQKGIYYTLHRLQTRHGNS